MRLAGKLIFTVLAAFALLSVAAGFAAAPKKGGTYVGKTSAITHHLLPGPIRGAVALYISPSGKKVVGPSHASGLMLPCPDGLLARGSVELRNAKIKNGKFSFKGQEGEDDVAMSGTFKKGGKVTGKVRYSRPYSPGGACKTSLTYTAKLKKRSTGR
jgi:hypothetical protein